MDLFDHISRTYGILSGQIEQGMRARPVTLRINTSKTTVEEVLLSFKRAGIAYAHVPWFSDALVVYAPQDEIENTPLYAEGNFYLQSLSSMLPPLLLEPKAGESILDMTAAPGGKTTELYCLSGGKALITACERDKYRFERLKFNLERQGASRVYAICKDATTLDDFLKFDKILLDAPCTGSGTVTDRDSCRFTEAYLEKCVRMQEKLLRKALKLLKKGGTLVYSTCSIFKEENELLLERVLPKEARFRPIPPMEGIPLLPSKEGTLTVCPSELYEGFFVARITV